MEFNFQISQRRNNNFTFWSNFLKLSVKHKSFLNAANSLKFKQPYIFLKFEKHFFISLC